MAKKREQKDSRTINYTIFNQKITFDHLKSHLWSAGDSSSSDINEERKLQIRELYEDWLKRVAHKILKRRVEIYAQKVGVNVQKISVKNSLKSRWASLTKKGSINFNVHLIKAPHDVVDYIILHEICHLKIRGHSHRYWSLLYRYMPNYQEKVDWLNLNRRSMWGDSVNHNLAHIPD
jgi:predicted metal-dependent hydrolase